MGAKLCLVKYRANYTMNPSNKKDTADVTSDMLPVAVLSAYTTEGLNKNLKTICDKSSLSMQKHLSRKNQSKIVSLYCSKALTVLVPRAIIIFNMDFAFLCNRNIWFLYSHDLRRKIYSIG